jgi:hypothetical protein
MDISGAVTAAIDSWLAALLTALLGPALAAVSELIFRTPSFAAIPAVAQTWQLIRGVVDALFVLAWLAAGLLIMTQGGIDARYSAKVVIPRVALAAILANASLVLCGALIALNNAVVDAVLAPSPVATLARALGPLLGSGHVGLDLIAVLVGLAAAVLAMLLVVLCIGRAFVLLLATALAPLALATYALPQTDELARLWWRVFTGLLFIQVVQAVLVRIASEVLAAGDWLGGPVPGFVSGLIIVTLLYALLRLPFAAYSWAFRARLSDNPVVGTIALGARAIAGVA